MKKANITISFDEEKLAALRLFLSQKSLELEAEISGFIEKLFDKTVPANVREYISARDNKK